MDSPVMVAWIVGFVLLSVTVTGLARRAGWSAPVVLVAVGAVISFIPGVPAVELQPEYVLYGVLPPLLFAAAFETSVVDVRTRRASILLLSVGLVVFTTGVVGAVTLLLLPTIGLAAAFAFAAVVAPTDASAVTALAGRLGLPRRVVTVLEGESLLNDATALLLLNTAIAAIVSIVSPWLVLADLVLAIAGGVAVGLLVGWGMSAVRRRLRSPVLDTSLALITPYFAFIVADAVQGSGVLAVVIAALYLGFRSPTVQSPDARVAEAVNWRTASFLLENAVFLFIGLNAAGILRGAMAGALGFWPTVGVCAAIVGALVAARFAFTFAMVGVFKNGSRAMRAADLRWKNAVIISAANVRGVVTLAAVFLLPPETPGRRLLQLLAFAVVVLSLLSGLALPWLVRRLGLEPPDDEQEYADWQRLMARAQASGVRRLREEVTSGDDRRVVEQLEANATLIADSLEQQAGSADESLVATYNRLRRIMIRAERECLHTARAQREFSEVVIAAGLRAIDAEELALRAAPVLEDTESTTRVRQRITPARDAADESERDMGEGGRP